MDNQMWAVFVLHDGQTEWKRSSKLFSRRHNAVKWIPSWFHYNINSQRWTYPGVLYTYKLMVSDLDWKDVD